MKSSLILLVLTAVFASHASADTDRVTCKSLDGSKQVKLVKLENHKFNAKIFISAPGSTKEPIQIQSDATAWGHRDGNVCHLDPAPSKTDGPWLITVVNQLSKVTLGVRFPLYSELSDRAEKLNFGPNTFFYCDIEDVKELLN